MNPQEPNGAVPPQQNEPVQPPIPTVVQIPGQEPLVVTPQQPVQPQHQPNVEHSPYEFILNPQKPTKAATPLAGGSTAKRALIFGGGLVVLIILATIISSLLSGGGNAAPLVAVAQEQTELIRISTAGETIASQETTKAFAYSVQLSIASANKQLATYATTNKIKLDPKVMGFKHSAAADTQLLSAQGNDTYNATLRSVLRDDLTSYSSLLKTAYSSVKGPKGREMLSKQYDDAQLLIQQSKD